MGKRTLIFVLLAGVLALTASAQAQIGRRVILDRADELEAVKQGGEWVTFGNGNVVFITETGRIYCDSARFVKGKYVDLKGHVLIDDADYLLKADSLYYDIQSGQATARGQHVELWSYSDSLYGVGVHAFYDKELGLFEMEERPIIYLKYPDTARMVEIIADFVSYSSDRRYAEASGNVIITSEDFSAETPCAVMLIEEDILDLYDGPVAKRRESEITGEFMSVIFEGDVLRRIDVMDSAYGEFAEPVDSIGLYYDRSILSGERITLNFENNDLDNVLCYGQAYSWYYPSLRGGRDYNENSVSGDTIFFDLDDSRLQSVTVVGGVVGTYVTGTLRGAEDAAQDDTSFTQHVLDSLAGLLTDHPLAADSLGDSSQVMDTIAISLGFVGPVLDTTAVTDSSSIPEILSPTDTLDLVYIDSVNYKGAVVEFSLIDSVIYLHRACEIQSGAMSLTAHDVQFDTQERLVRAYSANEVLLEPDTTAAEDLPSLAAELQPATIPVVLKDGDDELLGDYLEYSVDTEKGRIVQSKSGFEDGVYYGRKLFREQKDIFYVDDGYYTTCDADEPHFHFKASRMKLLEGEKMICRPVVFYLGRIPLMAIPYYVFPLKKGRRSGILPFRFGNFERGDRRITDLGYYWAGSDYWDWQGSLDYHERNRTITVRNQVNFKKRYVLDGWLNFEYRRRSSYNLGQAVEQRRRDYLLTGAYKHKITPTFEIRADGKYQSNKSYYTDYSPVLEDRLNREVRSKANFSKRFGKSTSLSGSFSHIVNLDKETRTDQLPSMSLSLPSMWLFGSGSTDENGKKVQRWYNGFILRYKPSLSNYSSRVMRDSTIAVDSVTSETVTYRSRKQHAKITHNPSLSLPTIRMGNYLNVIPGFRYSETWYKIWETDQSRNANIDASTTYRTYSYSGGVSANTNLYGTIYPNIGSLVGLRHVFSPSVGWSWSPELKRHPNVQSYAGGSNVTRKSSSVNVGIKHLLQAKVRQGEAEKNLQLLTINSSFSYNFRAERKPDKPKRHLSQISTFIQTSSIPRIRLDGRMTHSFYDPMKPMSEEAKWFSPFLTAFSFSLGFNLRGTTFLFDDVAGLPVASDSGSQEGSGGSRGWNLSVNYSFRESGLHSNSYSKSSLVIIGLGFNLTPSTKISYSQQYDFERDLTVGNSVNIVRQIHCWIGSLYWVPIGSNRGFGFKLNVIALPAIKIDNNMEGLESSSFRR